MIGHEFLCLRVFVRAMLRTFYYFHPSCHLSRREGFIILSTIGVTAKSKTRKEHHYERSRSIYHNPSSYCHHDFPSGHRLYAVFDAQKRQRPQRLQPCDEVTQFLINQIEKDDDSRHLFLCKINLTVRTNPIHGQHCTFIKTRQRIHQS